MGVWEIFCFICGGPLFNTGYIEEEEDGEYVHVETPYGNWLNDVYVITNKEKLLPMSYSNLERITWLYEKGDIVCAVTPWMWHEKRSYKPHNLYGIVCHRSCYKLIDQKLKHKILFANMCRKIDISDGLYYIAPKVPPKTREYHKIAKEYYKKVNRYGEMKKYTAGQSFDEEHLLGKNLDDLWLLKDPLTNTKNKNRILKMWRPIIKTFKKKPPRPSPCESATKFPKGTVLPGYDGNMWEVVVAKNKKKRWKLVKNAKQEGGIYYKKYIKYKKKYLLLREKQQMHL